MASDRRRPPPRSLWAAKSTSGGAARKPTMSNGFAGPHNRSSPNVSEDKNRCLVTGATGYIGGRLVPRLLDAGHPVRAMARNPDKLTGAAWRNRVEVVRGDLGDRESLAEAFDGVAVVYYLVHSMGAAKDFVAEEARSARNVVAAAQQAGV